MTGRWVVPLAAFALTVATGQSLAQKTDLAKLRACETITGPEVATLAGGKLVSPPLGSGGSCRYTVELAGGTVEAYQVSYQPAAGAEAMFKAQSPAEKGERIAQLWDEAWLAKRFMASGVSVTAVRRGDVAVEVSGERREVVLALAKLAVARVK